MDVDPRGFIHAEHLVGIEIALLDTPVLQRDLTVKRRGRAENDTALQLRLHRVWIDHGAAIHSAGHPTHPDIAVPGHLDFRHLSEITTEDELQRDAASTALGQGLTPTGLF